MKKFITRVRSALSGLLVPSISIALTLIVASVIVLLLGKNPLEVFLGFLRGSGLVFKPRYAGGQGILTDFFSYLSILTPMIFASLGVMMGLRAGLFNIGVAGQMLLPGFLASVFVGYSDLPTYLAWPLVIIIGLVAGGAMGALIGFLKHRFNIHEVVTSIMLNYIISYVTAFFINTYFADPVTRNSRPVSEASRLFIPGQAGGVRFELPVGVVLALLVRFVSRFLLGCVSVRLGINDEGLR